MPRIGMPLRRSTLIQLCLALVLGQPAAADLRSGPVVEDAGQTPRTELRYCPEPGATVRLEQVTRVEQRIEMNGEVMKRIPKPTWKIVMTNRVERVDEKGNIEMSLTYDEVLITEQGSLTDAQRDDLLTKARGLGFRAVVRCTPHGEVLGLDILAVPDADPALKAMFEGMGDGVLTLVHALPETPVGLGAQWISERSMFGGGSGATTVQVESIDAACVKVSAHAKGSGPGGPPPTPGSRNQFEKLRVDMIGDQSTTLLMEHPGAVEQTTRVQVINRMQGPNEAGETVPFEIILETNSTVRRVND